MSNSNAASEVDAAVWRALAGASVRIPALNSFVYYFPQGHLEHSQSAGANAATSLTYDFNLEKPFVHCQVRSIRFFCHPTTDQTFVKILLQPSLPYGPRSRSNDCFYPNDQNDVVSFVKVLSLSDANHGGGFGVPRDCVDLIFPRLDLLSRPAVQTLTFRDAVNKAWTFRHIYRGMPRRHMLSTGWTKFVNEKRLISGDSVVFMRKRSTNELFIGIRRVNNYSSGGGGDRCEVVEAIDKAARGVAFEVVYHPRPGIFNFLVNAEKMDESLRLSWSGGKRVVMGLETEDSPSGKNWYHGTITASATPNSGPWRGSPWRTIQVCWDTPERLRGMNKVSPWEIEYLPSLDTHPSKRMRLIMQPLPTTQLSLSMPGHLNYSPSPSSSSSSGIHGARRDHNNYNRLSKNDTSLALEPVSTVLNIGGPYMVSPQEAGRRNSFRLFGKTIQASEPSDNPSSSSTRPKSNGGFQLF